MKDAFIRFLVYLIGFICLLFYFGVVEAPDSTVSARLAFYLGFYGVLLSIWLIFCESPYHLKAWGQSRRERASADKGQIKRKPGG